MKAVKYILIIWCVSFLPSCTNNQKTSDVNRFFSIRGFFKSEASRLQKLNPWVDKLVTQNQNSERKLIRITNWKNELDLFAESDINKPSWKNSYQTDSTSNLIVYTAKERALRTRKIIISRSVSGKINRISIINNSENLLYSSSEELHYYPDSLYKIIKTQHVQVLGLNKYRISGKLQNNLNLQ